MGDWVVYAVVLLPVLWGLVLLLWLGSDRPR